MDYKVLYRKYRPDSFEKVVGQDYTISILKNSILNNKIAHAYIFNGPRGTGKTSTAKVFAKTINCENPSNGEACGKCNSCINIKNNPDIIEIDAASNNGVDEIRELINNIKIAPTYGKYKVYIIDEVHMMTQSAFNALLLTLEEPPQHVVFILATTNVESIPVTILSRCQKFDFKKIDNETLQNQIKSICKVEKIKISEEAIEEIAYLSEGGMRDALSILDQLSSNTKEIDLELIINNFGSVPLLIINNIIESLESNNEDLLRENIEQLRNRSIDYKVFIKKLIDQLYNKALENTSSSTLDIKKIKQIVFELIQIINNYNISIDPFMLIELTLLEYIEKTDNIEEISENKIISREIIKEEKKVEEPVENVEITSEEPKTKSKTKKIKNETIELIDKDARINNCFVNAKKEYLNKAKEILEKVIQENPDDSFLLSILVDCNVVAASDEIYILSSNLDSIVNLININYKLIEEKLENIKIIALTTEEWEKEKKEYVKNIKNGHQYTKVEEKDIKSDLVKEDQSLEEIAEEVFSSSKIEVEN